MKIWVQSLVSLSGLEIQHCRELCCRLQTPLRAPVAVAVVAAMAGSYSSDLTPHLGTSVCCRCGPKKGKKNPQKPKTPKTKQKNLRVQVGNFDYLPRSRRIRGNQFTLAFSVLGEHSMEVGHLEFVKEWASKGMAFIYALDTGGKSILGVFPKRT